MKPWGTFPIRIRPFQATLRQVPLIVLGAFLLTLAFNFRLFSATLAAFPTPDHQLSFVVSLAVVLCGLHVILLTMFSNRLLIKPVLSVLFSVAAIVAYFSDRFGTIIDDAMILNLLRTDSGEVMDLVTPELLLWFVGLGCLPVALLWSTKIADTSRPRVSLQKLSLLAIAIVVIAVSLFSFSSEYATFFRQYKTLLFYSNPIYPIYSVVVPRCVLSSRRMMAR